VSSVTDGREFASIGGDFSLTAGESLQIAVGGAGLGGDGTPESSPTECAVLSLLLG
jgi:hypothetical protein